MVNTGLCQKMLFFPRQLNRHGRARRRGVALFIAPLCALWALPPLGADQIVHGRKLLPRIKIVDMDGARIAYRTPAGALEHVHIAQVSRITVDTVGTLAQLNEAERLVAIGNYSRSITYYERALRVASDHWRILVMARLIQAADRADRIDIVSKQFVALLSNEFTGPALAAELLPETSPRRRSRGIERAQRQIDSVIDDLASQSARVLLEMLRFHIEKRSGGGAADRYAAELARQPIPPIVASRSTYAIKAAALLHWGSNGHWPAVLTLVDADLTGAPRAILPELLMVKARALAATGENENVLIRAGWTAMRVVIHYPDDPLAPEALLLTAELEERIGRVPTALQLLVECINHGRITAPVRDEVMNLKKRLQSTG